MFLISRYFNIYEKLQMFVIEGRLQTTLLFLQVSLLHTSDSKTQYKSLNNIEIWVD